MYFITKIIFFVENEIQCLLSEEADQKQKRRIRREIEYEEELIL